MSSGVPLQQSIRRLRLTLSGSSIFSHSNSSGRQNDHANRKLKLWCTRSSPKLSMTLSVVFWAWLRNAGCHGMVECKWYVYYAPV